MTTLDIFFAVAIVAPTVGLLMLTLAYVGITSMSYIANVTANIPSYYPVQTKCFRNNPRQIGNEA